MILLMLGTTLAVLVMASSPFGNASGTCSNPSPTGASCTCESRGPLTRLSAELNTNLSFTFVNDGEGIVPWPADEMALVESIIDDVMKNPMVKNAFVDIASKGPIPLRRVPELKGNPDAYAYVSDDGLNVTNFFFEEVRRWTRECRGFLFESPKKEMQRVLIHELAHIYSSRKGGVASDCSFLKASGWNWPERKLSGVDPSAVAASRAQGRELIASGQRARAADWTKSQARRHGYPTLYAMSSDTEAFAELFTFLALDESAPSYLRPSITNWFRDNVLDRQRVAVSCPPVEM